MSYLKKIDKKAIIYICVFISMAVLGSFTYTKLSSIDVKTASGDGQESSFTEIRTGETYDELKLKYDELKLRYDDVIKETKFLRGEVERLINDNKNLRSEKEELEERVREINQEIKSLVYKIDKIEQKL